MFQKPIPMIFGAGLMLLAGAVISPVQAQTTTRVSVKTGNIQGDAAVFRPKISADGRYVTYGSEATNLVTGDTNSQPDIFLTEIATRTTTRISVASGGTQANGNGSFSPSISGTGRYIAFDSTATNLVSGDTNVKSDVFVRDTVTGTTERVSVATGGVQSNGDSYFPAISRDGRYVAFESNATNLVTGDTNNRYDVFVYDRQLKTTRRVSVSTAGAQGDRDSLNAALSADGNVVAFYSEATNLVTGDTNIVSDVFVRNLTTNTTIRVSVATNGAQSDDTSGFNGIFLSGDGRYVAFDSYAATLDLTDTNLTLDVYVRDTVAGTTTRASLSSMGEEGDNDSFTDGISDDGRYVLFDSAADNLVDDDTNGVFDCFLRDLQAATTQRVSLGIHGQGNDESSYCSMTPDANTVAFLSYASNLIDEDSNGVDDDTNETADVFVRSPLQTTATVRGTLTLQGISSTAPDQLFTFTFRRTSGNIVRTASVSPNGTFAVSGLPRDTYTLLIKGGSYLASKVTVNATGGNVTLPNAILMRTGDITNDNTVDISDLLVLIAAYNAATGSAQYSSAADLNLDGVDDITDLLLLIGNYNVTGDTLP